MTDMEDNQLKTGSGDDHRILQMANFALAKFLARLNVAETETKILEQELRDLEKEIKTRKIKLFINKQ